jgi:hypothetical protein
VTAAACAPLQHLQQEQHSPSERLDRRALYASGVWYLVSYRPINTVANFLCNFNVTFLFNKTQNYNLVTASHSVQNPIQWSERFERILEERATLPTATVEATLASTIPASLR